MNFSLSLSVIVFGLSMLLATRNASASPDEIKLIPKFLANKNAAMSPQSHEALKWILDHWSQNSQAVFLELERQAQMRGHKIDFHDKELSLMVNSNGSKWDGVWAIAVDGETPTFQSTFCYYVELFRDKLVSSYVYGIGHTIGTPPRGKVRSALINRSIKNFRESHLSKSEIEMISGIWVATIISDVDNFNNCFEFLYPWKNKELDNSTYLKINDDLTCEIIVPYGGLSQNTWHGIVKSFNVDEFGKFVVLTKNESVYSNQTFTESIFISVENESRMSIRAKEIIWDFRRKLKAPFFDLNAVDSLISLRIGVLTPIPSVPVDVERSPQKLDR